MKIKYVFTALLAGATLMSCNDYLDVESESQYNDKVVFSNTPLAENTVISIYSWFAATNSHRARYMPYYGMNTDAECYYDMAQPSSDTKTSLCTYSAFSANNWMASGKDPNAFTGFSMALRQPTAASREYVPMAILRAMPTWLIS